MSKESLPPFEPQKSQHLNVEGPSKEQSRLEMKFKMYMNTWVERAGVFRVQKCIENNDLDLAYELIYGSYGLAQTIDQTRFHETEIIFAEKQDLEKAHRLRNEVLDLLIETESPQAKERTKERIPEVFEKINELADHLESLLPTKVVEDFLARTEEEVRTSFRDVVGENEELWKERSDYWELECVLEAKKRLDRRQINSS